MARKRVDINDLLETLRDGASGLDSSALAAAFYEQFGGAQGIAAKFSQEYEREGTSSMARVKILDGMMRFLIIAAGKAPPIDLSKLSDEALKQVIGEALDQAVDVDDVDDDGPDAPEDAGNG